MRVITTTILISANSAEFASCSKCLPYWCVNNYRNFYAMDELPTTNSAHFVRLNTAIQFWSLRLRPNLFMYSMRTQKNRHEFTAAKTTTRRRTSTQPICACHNMLTDVIYQYFITVILMGEWVCALRALKICKHPVLAVLGTYNILTGHTRRCSKHTPLTPIGIKTNIYRFFSLFWLEISRLLFFASAHAHTKHTQTRSDSRAHKYHRSA